MTAQQLTELVYELNGHCLAENGHTAFYLSTDGDCHQIMLAHPDYGGEVNIWDSEEDGGDVTPERIQQRVLVYAHHMETLANRLATAIADVEPAA